jgi:hypothetical protein
MKTTRVAPALALLAAGLLAAESAFAHGSRVTFGLHFGVPVGWGYYHPYPYYYYPPYYPPATVIVPAPPQTYIEQPPAPQAAPRPAQGWWHYCADSRAYYPYVKDCPGGWQRVAPQPSN